MSASIRTKSSYHGYDVSTPFTRLSEDGVSLQLLGGAWRLLAPARKRRSRGDSTAAVLAQWKPTTETPTAEDVLMRGHLYTHGF